MRSALALLLLTVALIPCGLLGDGCDESGPVGCSQLCHLGCAAVAPLAAPVAVAEALPLVRQLPPGFAAVPRSLAASPELPPPRA